MECEHNYELLDVEKKETRYRFNSNFTRTTRFFCTKCVEIKERIDNSTHSLNENPPSWTQGIKNVTEIF